LKALGDLRLGGLVPVRSIYTASERIGDLARHRRNGGVDRASRSV
jgi:hypothetical protein